MLITYLSFRSWTCRGGMLNGFIKFCDDKLTTIYFAAKVSFIKGNSFGRRNYSPLLFKPLVKCWKALFATAACLEHILIVYPNNIRACRRILFVTTLIHLVEDHLQNYVQTLPFAAFNTPHKTYT